MAAVIVVGAELGWIAPVVALFAAIFGTSAGSGWAVVTWMVKPDRSSTAVAVAAGYLALGAALTTSHELRLLTAGVRLKPLLS